MRTLKYEPEQMCYWLNASGLFQNLKCSSSLGAARLEYKGMNAFVSASGRVTIRNAEKAEGDGLMALLSRCLWPAKYCICNRPAIDCCRGSCGYCNDHVCEALGGDHGAESDLGNSIVKRASSLAPAMTSIEMLMDRFKEMVDDITDSKDISGRNFDEQYDGINKEVSSYMVATQKDNDAALGMFVAGIAANVKGSIDIVAALGKKGINDEEAGALVEARNLVVGAFNALATSNSVAAINIINSHRSFVENNKGVDSGIIEIGNNGLRIAKLISRPIPK